MTNLQYAWGGGVMFDHVLKAFLKFATFPGYTDQTLDRLLEALVSR